MRKIFRYILLCIIIFSTKNVIAQTVSGTVSGAGTAAISISVTAKPSGKGVTTDNDGKYSLSLPAGTYKITYSGTGYKDVVETVTLVNGDFKTIDVVLTQTNQNMDEIVIVGSRSLPRSSANSPLPVDNIDSRTLKTTGQLSFDKALQYRVPSFNTVNTPVNDATTLLDPYEIRNLGPSRTLVLINGKRKNLSSLLYVQFSPGRGETGSDLSAIPTDAIKRIEILRDGASAQYGSDAIAGVMNVILKDKYEYSSLTLNGGVTSKGDGSTYGLSYNSGANFGSKGFINYTADFSQQNNAVRSGLIDLTTEIANFGDPSQPVSSPGNKAIADYLAIYPTANNKNGTGEITAAKFSFNLGMPIGEHGLFYSNAGFVSKKAISNANFRPPYWRSDAGLLHQAGTTYIGYGPSFEGDLVDYNGTIGFKNEVNGWKSDVSLTIGGNSQLYAVNNTVNRTLGAASPTSFKPGGYSFTNVIGNYDISKSILENFSIGFGTEIRKETYAITAGDTASYSGEGANSFPGIRQENATTNSRYNIGAYLDASWDISKSFLLNGTIRQEKYSDFGSAFVWKASSRYKIAGDNLVIRGSASTGFRAPTLHQIYTQSTQASFVGGTIALSGLFNNRSKQAFALGIPLLKPEKSENYTIGLGVNPTSNLSFTLDYYSIIIKDRIVYSSSISSNDPTSTLGVILANAGVKTIQFFINGIKTRTQGLDFVGSYKNINLGSGRMAINLSGNYTINNEIVGSPNDPSAIKAGGSTILNTQIKSLLTESRPKYKAVAGIDYHIKKLSINLNETLFGSTKFQDLDNGSSYSGLGITSVADPKTNAMEDIKQKFSPAVVTDLNIGYDIAKKVNFSFSINNLFNVLPKWKLEAQNPNGQTVIDNSAAKNLLEGLLAFSGRYRILGYNGSQFSQLGTTFQASLNFRF